MLISTLKVGGRILLTELTPKRLGVFILSLNYEYKNRNDGQGY